MIILEVKLVENKLTNASQVSNMLLQVPASRHLTLILDIEASCKVEQGIAFIKGPIKISNEPYAKENNFGYKKKFSSPKHAKHEIKVCDGGPEVHIGDSGPDPGCDSTGNEPSLMKASAMLMLLWLLMIIYVMMMNLDQKMKTLAWLKKIMVVDESVSRVDTPVRDVLNACKVGVSILNTQNDEKVDGIVVVHVSVCIFNDTLIGYQSACKIGLPVAVVDNTCNVKDTITISQSVCMVDCHGDVDQSVCKIDAYDTKAQENGSLTLFNIVVNDK